MLKHLIKCLVLTIGIFPALTFTVEAGEYGPVGGKGGRPFYYVSENGSFTEILIRSARRIDGLIFINGSRSSSIYGGRGGDRNIIGIGRQCIIAIRGTTDIARNKRKTRSIFSLEFIFANGSSTGRYGRNGNQSFSLSAPSGEEIIGFFGRHGAEIDAIGIITGPSRCSRR